MNPTYQHYATHDESDFPHLWRGVVGAWAPCLGPSGTRLHEHSGRANWGTLTNMDPATDWIVNRGQYALDFDGSNDFVSVGQQNIYSIGTTTELSFVVWMRSTSIPNTAALISRSAAAAIAGRWALFGTATSWTLLATAAGGGTAAASGTVANAVDGNWHCWCGVFGGGTHQLYVDGIQRATGTYDSTATNTIAARSLLFGKYNDSSGGETATIFQFPGQLDSMFIWDRKITPNTIYEAWQIGRGGMYTPRRRRRAYSFGPSFQAAWARGSNVILQPCGVN